MNYLSEEAQNILRTVIETLPYGIMLIDWEGKVLGMNRNLSFMLNIATPGSSRKHYSEILDEPLKAIFDKLIEDTKKYGFVFERHNKISLAGNIPILVGMSSSVLRNDQGVPFGISVICRDMSATQELERMREIDKLKTDFLATVSHDLKAPLTSICGYADVLIKFSGDKFNSEELGFLQIINEEGMRLTRMINDMLNVATIESGALKLKSEQVILGDIIHEVIKVSLMQNKKINFIVNIDSKIPSLWLDKGKMMNVFLNLVNNAIKYSSDEGTIRIEGYVKDENVYIEVIDRGVGMSQEMLSHLFEKFFRGDSNKTRGIKGTGLGLVIAKGIVEAHGGSITVKSQLGEGSTFSVILPLRLSNHKSEG